MGTPELLQPGRPLFAYGPERAKTPLPVIGRLKGCLWSPITKKETVAEFYVMQGNAETLLGQTSSLALGLVKFFGTNAVKTRQSTLEELTDEYKDRFEGIGKMKDTLVKLHINEDVKPIQQKPRPVPFNVRDDADKELERLESLDIIEKATGPTPWISPLVIVHKPVGVRICIDSRVINTAIERERHPIPTIDELIADMTGATVFSKIDLNKGYHQLELHPDSRPITTFRTHQGVHRYKCLSFGMNSAAEIFPPKKHRRSNPKHPRCQEHIG